MTPNIPLPTDNIYKFTCMFGLALIVVAVFSYVSVYTSSLNSKVKYIEIVIALEGKPERTKAEEDLLKLNKELLDVTKSNEGSTSTLLATTLYAGIVFSLIGAGLWFEKIQRRDDRLAGLQISKLEAEIAELERKAREAAAAASEANPNPPASSGQSGA